MKPDVRSQIDVVISLLTVGGIVILDRLTKLYLTNLLDVGESLPVIRGAFHLTLVHNTGIAFGLFKDQGLVFIIVPIIAIVLLGYNVYFYRNNEQQLSRLYIVAFSLILGGAIGNLIDRIMYGYVIDFFDLRIWPVFNIADSAITIGAIIIAINFIPQKRRR